MAVLLTTQAFAQSDTLPFHVGERLQYRVSVGKFGNIGEGSMSVAGPVDVRGTPTLVLRSEIRVGDADAVRRQIPDNGQRSQQMPDTEFGRHRTRGTLPARDTSESQLRQWIS
jgi:hypothetical protein